MTTRLISFFAITFCAPLACWAAPITVPTDLNPGDQYRLAFVTRSTRDATSFNIADYNDFVTGVANSVPELLALGTTWTAIGSTRSVDARDNTDTNPTVATGAPIYRLDDTRIAASNTDLWSGAILAPLSTDETGRGQPEGEVATAWTGSHPDGTNLFKTGALGGDPFLTSIEDVIWGYVTATDTTWMLGGTAPESESRHLYGISGILTVVPEPGTMILACIGAAALAGCMLRRRRHRQRP